MTLRVALYRRYRTCTRFSRTTFLSIRKPHAHAGYQLGYQLGDQRSRPQSTSLRYAFSIAELLVALCIIGVVSTIVSHRLIRSRNLSSVLGASNEAEALFSTARQLAITQTSRVSVHIDTSAGTMSIQTIGHAPQTKRLKNTYDVDIRGNRNLVTYATNGLTVGASNLTLVISKGHAADTLTISRLGRIKRKHQ